MTLDVRSVLPTAPPDSSLSPQPPAALVRRSTVSLIPLAALWLATLLLLLPLHLWWRRRGPPTRAAPTGAESRGTGGRRSRAGPTRASTAPWRASLPRSSAPRWPNGFPRRTRRSTLSEYSRSLRLPVPIGRSTTLVLYSAGSTISASAQPLD